MALKKPIDRGINKLRGKVKEVSHGTAQVFFICTGIVSDNGITAESSTEHDEIIVGATLERFKSWNELWTIRRHARRDNLLSAVQEWDHFCANLVSLEKRLKDQHQANHPHVDAAERTLAVRRMIDSRDLPPADVVKLAPLRAHCEKHLGQAFGEDNYVLKHIPCCYFCRLTIGYRELLPGDRDDTLSRMDVVGRARNASSCAEVLSSKYCMAFRRVQD